MKVINKTIKRYDFEYNDEHGICTYCPHQNDYYMSKDGAYVKYEDVKHMIDYYVSTINEVVALEAGLRKYGRGFK